jgi:hypothetical protein
MKRLENYSKKVDTSLPAVTGAVTGRAVGSISGALGGLYLLGTKPGKAVTGGSMRLASKLTKNASPRTKALASFGGLILPYAATTAATTTIGSSLGASAGYATGSKLNSLISKKKKK